MRLIERRKKGVFIQPTVGISTNVFDTGFTSRLVWVNLDQAGNSSSGVFIEPVVTTKLGFKNIKAIAQLGLSYPMN